jgi:internalin A
LPPEIGQLTNLCLLDLEHNRFQQLPSEISRLQKLADYRSDCPRFPDLRIFNNPLISPPPEVVAQGTPAILDYLRNQAAYHTRQLILSGAGVIAGVLLLARWRYRRNRKPKKKNDVIS